MKLLTKEIEKLLPKLYSQDGKNPANVKIVVKFFAPWTNWTWYVTEGERQENGDWLFFGLTRGDFNELGYFTLRQLQEVKGAWGLKIERDMHFGYNHTLAEAQESQI